MNGRLYRSRDERMIAGVAGGLALNLNIDPSIVRILWVVLVPLTGGFIILLYFLMAFIVPEQPLGDDRWAAWEREAEPAPDAGWTAYADDPTSAFEPVPPAPTPSPFDPMPPAPPAPATPPMAPLTPSAFRDAPRPTSGSGPGAPGGPSSGWRPPGGDRRAPWPARDEPSRDRGVPLIFGLILVLVGAYFLARSYIPGIDWGAAWPFLLVGIGLALLLGSLRRSGPRT
jgi:phage shock protein C